MMNRRWRSGLTLAAAVWATATVAACDSEATGIDGEASGVAVLVGSVNVSGGGGATAADLSGISVSVDGQAAHDITDLNGNFRLEAMATADDPISLRFRKGAMDVSIRVDGVQPGTLVRVDVTVNSTSATVDSTSSSSHSDFEGNASLVDLSGTSPSRVLTLNVASDTGSVQVRVLESTTAFDTEGDLVTFEALARRVTASLPVRVEGDSSVGPNGLEASFIKAETDDDDDENDDDNDDNDDNDDEDFEGYVTDIVVTGTSPSRVVQVSLRGDTSTYTVDIVEGTTTFDGEGDIHSIDALLNQFAAGDSIEVEGDGDLAQSGVFVARSVKVETDDDDDDDSDDDDSDDDFEGKVTSLVVSTSESGRTMRVTLVDDDDAYTVDIVEGSTSFDSSGDYTTFDEVIAAHGAGQALEMDGEGQQQEDGVIVATEVEVERDD